MCFKRVTGLIQKDICFCFQVGFKKTKRRVKKIRKKEKPVKDDDILTDDTRSTDFGSRLHTFLMFLILDELFLCPSALQFV